MTDEQKSLLIEASQNPNGRIAAGPGNIQDQLIQLHRLGFLEFRQRHIGDVAVYYITDAGRAAIVA